VIGGGAFFIAQSEQLAALALRHAVPTVYEGRDFVAVSDAYRLAGIYAGRILKR